MTHMSWSVLKRNPPLRACYYFSRCQLDPKTLIEQLTRCYTPQRVPAVVGTAVFANMRCKLSSSFLPFFFSYQNNNSVVNTQTAWMGNNTRMGECVNIDVTSGPSFRTAASVVRTYNNTPPQFANVWLLFLFTLKGLFIFLIPCHVIIISPFFHIHFPPLSFRPAWVMKKPLEPQLFVVVPLLSSQDWVAPQL